FKAYTKQEGLNIFNSKNIDFIILDCNLPDGDGFDVCQIIREKEYQKVTKQKSLKDFIVKKMSMT
ncbi:response regulator, partial [Clostridioides difficile]